MRKAINNCQVCNKSTTYGKPYCIEHLDRIPYIYFLTETLRTRETEIEQASESINLNGLFAWEILELLEKCGPQPLEQIAYSLDAPINATNLYLNEMVSSKLVNQQYELTDAGFETLLNNFLV